MKKGISLIVLVITIVVILILAAAVILSLGENNPIKDAKKASVQQEYANLKDELLMYSSKMLSASSGVFEINKLSADKNGVTYTGNDEVDYTDKNIYDILVSLKDSNNKEEYTIVDGEIVYSEKLASILDPDYVLDDETHCSLIYNEDGVTRRIGNIIKGSTVNIGANAKEKEGHTFSKWTEKPDGTGTSYVEGDTITLNETTTLYANYTPKNYSVLFLSGNLFEGLDSVNSYSDSRATYSMQNRQITVTANSNDGYMWIVPVTVKLEKDKTYRFSCDVDCDLWNGNNNVDSVQAFLVYNSLAIELSSANYEFTYRENYTGDWYLRFDVNKNGETHTFSNVKMYEVVKKDTKAYNQALGTLPSYTPAGSSEAISTWYTQESGGEAISNLTLVKTNSIYYAH